MLVIETLRCLRNGRRLLSRLIIATFRSLKNERLLMCLHMQKEPSRRGLLLCTLEVQHKLAFEPCHDKGNLSNIWHKCKLGGDRLAVPIEKESISHWNLGPLYVVTLLNWTPKFNDIWQYMCFNFQNRHQKTHVMAIMCSKYTHVFNHFL